MKKSKLYEIVKIITYTVIPFLLPCIFNIDVNIISRKAQWIIFSVVSVFDLSGLIFFKIKDRKKDIELYENEAIRHAYSNIYKSNTIRRDYFVEQSYSKKYQLDKKSVPYNVHVYIKDICESFADTIAHITNIKKENISVSFIYHYSYENATEDDTAWRWISGRELTMNSALNDYVMRNETIYHYLMTSNVTAVFCNDKCEWADNGRYYMSSRDYRHNRKGSFFASKVAFSNNGNQFIEGIIMVSTYGKKFVEANNFQTINNLKKLIIDDIFPCYQRMLEAELGVLYFRHEKVGSKEIKICKKRKYKPH